jgi:NAD(P)-dependent dehydrogenase (short-subunit alcohol dehydrogenase family)
MTDFSYRGAVHTPLDAPMDLSSGLSSANRPGGNAAGTRVNPAGVIGSQPQQQQQPQQLSQRHPSTTSTSSTQPQQSSNIPTAGSSLPGTRETASSTTGSTAGASGSAGILDRVTRTVSNATGNITHSLGLFTQKSVEEQVILITGASSGIGLATVRAAAKRGARLVLAARNGEELNRIASELEQAGAQVLAVPTDISDSAAVDALREAALRRFGRIDTWINNAAVSIYGKLHQLELEEARRLFDVNFWGVVHGSRAAVRALREHGGTLINVGSVLSDRSMPIQGMYAASKHAVKGYTDALRMEVEMEKLPIQVTLIKPATIATPYTEHARSHLSEAPSNPPPSYAPEIVADAILFCAEHKRRDFVVGGFGKFYSLLETFAPRLADYFMEFTMERASHSGRPKEEAGDNLYQPARREGRVRSRAGPDIEWSPYNTMAIHPTATLIAFLVLVGLVIAFGSAAFARVLRC